MFHYFDSVTDNYGNALAGWQVEVYDIDTGAVIPIFADLAGTVPIADVSGIANRAVSDQYGNIEFYIPSGNYDLTYYNPRVVHARTKANVAMFNAAELLALINELDARVTALESGSAIYTPSLDFSNANNSQYIPAIAA